ncbi:hypothetical protein ACFL0Q_07620 [Thermodesulfobacteriota bacterium]
MIRSSKFQLIVTRVGSRMTDFVIMSGDKSIGRLVLQNKAIVDTSQRQGSGGCVRPAPENLPSRITLDLKK